MGTEHICVCICTFKRPKRLAALLDALGRQQTAERFTYDVMVVDNDHQGTAARIARADRADRLSIRYALQPEQNIALARNRAVANAHGDYVAFIDDDEVPPDDWLLTLYTVLKSSRDTAGVLGPVLPRFEERPPKWVRKARLFERPSHATGDILTWQQTRTGNAMLRHNTLSLVSGPFRKEFGSGGEDRDFFRRAITRGARFTWCNEAPVFEAVPPQRCRRSFLLRRALLRGQASLAGPDVGVMDLLRSLLAVLSYAIVLPAALVAGQHVFMKIMIRSCDHLGKVLGACGIRLVRDKYITQ